MNLDSSFFKYTSQEYMPEHQTLKNCAISSEEERMRAEHVDKVCLLNGGKKQRRAKFIGLLGSSIDCEVPLHIRIHAHKIGLCAEYQA